MTTSYRITIFVLSAFLLAIASCYAATEEAPVDSHADYDPDNIFAHILRGDLPAEVVFENGHALAFHDIRPQARVHVLVGRNAT